MLTLRPEEEDRRCGNEARDEKQRGRLCFRGDLILRQMLREVGGGREAAYLKDDTWLPTQEDDEPT